METLSSGIQYRHWPVKEAKACIVLIHGLAEHTGRYERLAAYFNARKIYSQFGTHMQTIIWACCNTQLTGSTGLPNDADSTVVIARDEQPRLHIL